MSDLYYLGPQFIWTKRAISQWEKGKQDPAHTISAPNVADIYDGLVRQLRPGTPWMLVEKLQILAQGVA